jgi:predicted anti-sigma-YlaC factor YlaD
VKEIYILEHLGNAVVERNLITGTPRQYILYLQSMQEESATYCTQTLNKQSINLSLLVA